MREYGIKEGLKPMARTNAIGSLVILQLALGCFFLIMGLEEVLYHNSTVGQFVSGLGKVFGDTKYPLEMTIAIIEIIVGVVVILSLFVQFPKGLFNLAILIVFVLWAVKIVYVHFITKEVFTPSWLTWLKGFSLDLIVLLSVWLVRGRQEA